MGVTTDKKNKPFNPRGNDQSPLAFNRAKLYSGKALSFDGVNDNIAFTDFEFTAGNKYSLCIYANRDNIGTIWSRNNQWIEINFVGSAVQLRTYDTGWNTYTLIDDVPANEWHQIVITYDVNANTWASYLNGQFVKSITAAEPDNKRINRIGSTASGFYDGEFANAKIFEVALTAAQVADLYNNPELVVPTGVDNTALKLWLPMQEGAGTTALNGAPDAIGSELVTNGDFASNINDWAAKDCTIVWDNGKIKCDNSSGNGGGGAYQNVGLQNSKTYRFTATIQLISASGNGTFRVFSSSANGTGQSTRYTGSTLVAGGDAVTEIGEFTTGTDGDVTVQFNVDRTNAVFTIDNVSVKEVFNNGTISGATWTHGIGAPVAQTSVIDWNKHTLDGTNAVLIPQGLTSGRDLLGNLFENVRKQGALNLDGNSWAEVHDNASLDFGTGSFSIEAWVRVKYVAQGSAYNAVMTLGGDVAQKTGLVLVSNLEPRFIYNGNTSSIAASTLGNWIHMMGVYNETNATFYVNGSQVDQDARTAVNITNDLVKYIGRGTASNRYYNDQIAQPRIYNRALTAEEVQRNYNAGKNTYTN